MLASVAMAAALMILGQVPKSTEPETKAADRPAMINDPMWSAKPGAHGEVIVEGAPGSVNGAAFTNVQKFRDAKDQIGVKQLIDAKRVGSFGVGTPVLVIKTYRPEEPAQVFSSASSFAQSLLARALEPKENWPIEVRMLDGEFKGQVRFFNEDDIGHLVPAPPKLPPPGTRKAKPTYRPTGNAEEPAARAATLLKLADNLRVGGKPAAAADYYKRIVKDFPGTPSAKAAAERLDPSPK